jgi:hypothetical protein
VKTPPQTPQRGHVSTQNFRVDYSLRRNMLKRLLKRLCVYSTEDEEDKYSVRQFVMLIVALVSKRAVAMRRASWGVGTPQGTVGQELAAEKMFDEF